MGESTSSIEDASEEHESIAVVDSRPDLYSDVYGEQSVDPMGDIQDSVSPMMSHLEQHMMEHDSAEEDNAHNMHDEPFRESQLEVHIEPAMEEDGQPPVGSAINE